METYNAIALDNRTRSLALGASYGLQMALDPTQLPPLNEKSIGSALSQFEAGVRIGLQVGLTIKHSR